ncbi:MAG: carboxypeptidase-like regulatory domain-containing protein [Rhodothermaceae bacterium]|nr:carboxypeptidase-like regulatory domain-containing protein [Rhodothermaceae bacterium]
MKGLVAGLSSGIGMFMLLAILCIGVSQNVLGQPVQTATPSAENVTVHLDQASLKEALRLLGQETGVSIVYNEQYLPQRILSGSFSGNDIEQVLEKLLYASSLRIIRTGDYQVVIAPEENTKPTDTPTINIDGIVRDRDSGLALVGATVYSKRLQNGIVTNSDGRFSLKEIPTGQHAADTLVVQYVGYETLTIPASSLQPDQIILVELGIQSVTLDEVRVTSDRLQDGVAVADVSQYKLLPKDLEWIPGAGDDKMIRALQLLPGISGGQDGRSELIIRGSTPFQHLFSLNGITLYNTHHLFGFSSAINEEIIGSLELYKGGFPARYGGRISGVIEASGEPGNFDRFQASIGLNGLHAGGKVSVPLSGNGAILVAFRRSFNELFETRFYRKLLNSSLGRKRDDEGNVYVNLPPDQLGFQDIYTQATLQLDPKSTANATLYHSEDEFDYFYFNPELNISEDLENPEYVMFDERNSVNAKTLGLSSSIDRKWDFGGKVEASFSYTRFSNGFNYFVEFDGQDYYDAKTSFNRNKLSDYGVQLRTVIPIGNQFVTDIGGWINDTRVEYAYQHGIHVGTFEEKALIRGGYAQVHWEVRPGVILTPGVRATEYSLHEDLYIEPRFRAQYQLDENVYLKAAYGTYYQFVDRLDHFDILDERSGFWALAQDEVQPTRSTHRILGVRWERPNRFIDVEFFSNALTGISELGQLTDDNLLLDENDELFVDGTGIQQGLEILVQQTSGPIRGWFSYGYTQSERQLDGRNQGNWYPTSQDFRHTASVVAHYALGPWQWSLSWQLASGQPYTQIIEQFVPTDLTDPGKTGQDDEFDRLLFSGPINGRRLQPGHRLDVAMKRSFSLKNVLLDVGVSVFNAYNYRSVWRRDYNQYSVPIESIEYLSPGVTPTLTLRVSYL